MQLLKADLSNISGGGSGGGGNIDFGDKTVVAAEFQGAVTGTVSSISNHSLTDLGDVDTNGVTSGQVLYYTGTEWQATTLSSSFNGGNVGGITNFLNALESSATTNGGVVVSGGIGIAKNTNIGGNLAVSNKFTVTALTGNTVISGTLQVNSTTELRSNSELRLFDADNTQYIGLKSPANVTTNLVFTLPATDGQANQALVTNGSGQLNWATITGGGGGGGDEGGGVEFIPTPPGGSNTQVQFNSNGVFAGDADFTYDQLTNTITVGAVGASTFTGDLNGDVTGDVTGNVAGNVTGDVTGNVTGNIESTGTSTFSNAVVSGGAVDNAPVGAETASTGAFTTLTSNGQTTFTNNEDSSSTVTGAVRVSGGLGVALNANIGGSMTVNSTIISSGNIVANSNVVINNSPTQPTHAANKGYVDSRALALSIALGG
jgi:hypothetical protein